MLRCLLIHVPLYLRIIFYGGRREKTTDILLLKFFHIVPHENYPQSKGTVNQRVGVHFCIL